MACSLPSTAARSATYNGAVATHSRSHAAALRVVARSFDPLSVNSPADDSPSTSSPDSGDVSPRQRVRRAVAAEPGVVQLLKARARADRSFKLLSSQAEGGSGLDRLSAFLSAVGLLALAWYGQDLIAQLGQLTKLPVEEIDWAIYFLIAFQAVSLVIPGGGGGSGPE